MKQKRIYSQKWFRALFHRRMLIALMILLQAAFLVYLILDGSRISSMLSVLLRIVSLVVALYIISKRNKGAFKLTWVFTILIFPLFGGLFYLLFQLQMTFSPLHMNEAKIEAKARPLYFLPGDGYKEAMVQIPEYAAHTRYLQKFAGFPIFEETETQYYASGESMWTAMLNELEKAEKYIFLEYFIIEEGRMWNAILEILQRKAKEGVTVRIIYDDFGCFFRLPRDFAEQMKASGIGCIAFNPFRPIFSVHQNNRDHRKIAVIDGEVAFTGGINLADAYINEIEIHGHWKDSAVMLRGKGAWSLTLMFLQTWEMCNGQPEDFSAFYPHECKYRVPQASGFVQPYADSPIDNDNVGEHVYLQIIGVAKDYLYITTPYLIVDDSMISALTLAAKSGVDVRIMTPHIADKKLVHMTTRSYYRELIKAGVKVYEYERGFVHAKNFVADDRTAAVGTTNMDFRSLYLHFECGVRFYDCPAVYEVKKDFLDTLSVCREISLRECSGNMFTRLIQDILRLFAPLM